MILIRFLIALKLYYSQLFGVIDPDEDVSPDTADPEAAGAAGEKALKSAESNGSSSSKNVSTRQWAQDVNYDAVKLFCKFFNEDIKYLLSMENLWAKRRPPVPLDVNSLPDTRELVSSIILMACEEIIGLTF